MSVPSSPEATGESPDPGSRTVRTRRPRGEPRRLLLDSARRLFSEQDYRSVTTREIAESAGVAEHLIFRHFGSKAALFRGALVMPFVTFVENFEQTWRAVDPTLTEPEELASQFLGEMYDLFVDHRGLVVTLWASESLSDDELADAGLDEVDRALASIGRFGAESMPILGMQAVDVDLAARSTVAMVAGMAAFRSNFFGSERPSRDAIVAELTQAILHGFLHRRPGEPVSGSPAPADARG